MNNLKINKTEVTIYKFKKKKQKRGEKSQGDTSKSVN